jgi:hypothetical protein
MMDGIGHIQITAVDTGQFPSIDVWARIYDSDLRPAAIVSGPAIQVVEDQQEVRFSIDKLAGPLVSVLVIDLNANAFLPASTQQSRAAVAMETVRNFIVAMQPGDRTALLTTSQAGVKTLAHFSEDQTELLMQLSQLNDWEKGHFQHPSFVSDPMAGIRRALLLLKTYPQYTGAPLVLLVTPNYHPVNDEAGAEVVSALVQRARQEVIPLFLIQTNSTAESKYLEQLANETRGGFFSYQRANSLDPLTFQITAQRSLFRIRFRSKSGSDQSRTLVISSKGGNVVLAKKVFKVNPPPQPAQLDITTDPPSPITRQAPRADSLLANIPPTQVTVHIAYRWNDSYPRKIQRVKLYVDGEMHGRELVMPQGETNLTWDIRNFNTLGEKIAQLRVDVEDELGLVSTSDIPITVIVQEPAPTPMPTPALTPLLGVKA